MKYIIDSPMWLLYYAGVYAMVSGIRISSLWNEKSRQWLAGRVQWKKKLAKIPPKTGKRIWFHISSLGEFEQAKPVIEELKERSPDTEFVLTFFSPSGFLSKRSHSYGPTFYLPADLPGNAEAFIRLLNPDLAVFVKYDLWPGFLHQLSKHDIPSLLISANWSPDRKFSSWTFPLNQMSLRGFDRIFFQREDGLIFFQNKGFRNIQVAGDTRIDRSLHLPQETDLRLPENLKGVSYDLIAGSTWPADEELIIHAIEKLNLRVLIAPHDVSLSNIVRLKKSLPCKADLMSECNSQTPVQPVMIVDSIGLLSVLYHLGKIAYVGGGFGRGIHNILEPAAHAKPVLFGPSCDKFPEANDLIEEKAAYMVRNKKEMIRTLENLLQAGSEEAGAKAFEYLHKHAGATKIVSGYILDNYLAG